MIDADYRNTYNRMFRELLDQAPRGGLDECGLPSYTHRNLLMKWLFWRRIHAAFGLCEDIAGKRVLDFGCGAGVAFKYLCEKGCVVTGCDNEFAALAQNVARRLGMDVTLVTDLNEIEGSVFDYIFALDVLEHVEDLRPILNRFVHLSHERTRIIVSGPTENWAYRFGRFLAGFSGTYHVSNVYEAERGLRRAGFRRLALRRLYFPIPLFRVSSWARGGSA